MKEHSHRLITAILLALFFGVSLYLRIALPYARVVSETWIKFSGTDAYYHMRLVDNLLHHFPHRITFDPYTFYPHGTTIPWPPFFDWLIGGIAWLAGLGTPTQHTIDIVGIYTPAILGALVILPVYFIGKAVLNRWVGIIAAGLISIMPGEFLGRSILGYTDHHVAEVLLSSLAMLFLILAIKTAKQHGLSKDMDWTVKVLTTKPLLYSLLAGVSLWLYLITWVGGLLFIFLIFTYFLVQFIVDHLRGERTIYLAFIGVPVFAIAMLAQPFLPPTTPSPLCLPSLAIAVAGLLVMAGISHLLASRRIKAPYYALSLLLVGILGIAVFYFTMPSFFKEALAHLRLVFAPAGAALTILEVRPILFPQGEFSLSVIWGNFTTAFFLSLVSLAMLIYAVVKRGEADKLALVVWSLVILTATLGQRRFAYYLSVNVALLTAYICWLGLEFAGFRESFPTPQNVPDRERKKEQRKRKTKARPKGALPNMILGTTIIFLVAFLPNAFSAKSVASATVFAPSDAWLESLTWMKHSTPEPFGDYDFYYVKYSTDFRHPAETYGVMSWWDYGHLITRVAHRPAIANPFQQGANEAARFLTCPDETTANQTMLALGARYVVLDLATATTKFHGAAAFANIPLENFYETYYIPEKGRLKPVILYYPEYFRTMVARLYNFDGASMIPDRSLVVAYQEKITPTGHGYKEVTDVRSFSSYQEAEVFVASQKGGNYRIVSDNPFLSPVPLERLGNYKLIYSSTSGIMHIPGVGITPEVKIFEFLP